MIPRHVPTPHYQDDAVTIWHGNALDLPIPDESVDLCVTSPPYFGLRSYTDGGEHYDGQIGSEATPGEFIDALIAATTEMVRVLKPSGSIWLNLGDKYAGSNGQPGGSGSSTLVGTTSHTRGMTANKRPATGASAKSLIGIPWRYAIRCIDELGLILRAEVIWAKPNGLPESVTDRVRRSHEQWFHFTREPRYFSAVDEIREEHLDTSAHAAMRRQRTDARLAAADAGMTSTANPLGKLPGSVWEIPTQPLTVPAHLGIDHFAAFPMEWPRRIIRGWSPSGFCVDCGEGRRPVAERASRERHNNGKYEYQRYSPDNKHGYGATTLGLIPDYRLTGYACACATPTAPTRPAVVLDPFGGTGTTALVAKSLGRTGWHVDLSADYCRLAQWRVTDPGELARALQVEKPPPAPDGMDSLLDLIEGGAA